MHLACEGERDVPTGPGVRVHTRGGAFADPDRPLGVERGGVPERSEIEQQLRRLKGFRRIFPRFEELDAILLSLIVFALIPEAAR